MKIQRFPIVVGYLSTSQALKEICSKTWQCQKLEDFYDKQENNYRFFYTSNVYLERLGLAGVESGFLLALNFCLFPGGSSFKL